MMTILATRAILMAWTLTVVAAGAAAPVQGTAPGSRPRLYVFTEAATPDHPAGPDQLARQQVVTDLREELRKRPKFLEVVEVREGADAIVEVLRREAPSASKCVIAVKLRTAGGANARSAEVEGRTWSGAQSMLVDLIQRWVNETFDVPAAATF